jgi:plasmid stabilization system protein ParE
MPQGDKSKYTGKQERKADHIADSYEHKGVPEKEAERRAWATVNKDDGGGKQGGSGEKAHTGHPAAHRGGELGGKAAAERPAADRHASAVKAAATRKKNAAAHH